MPAKPRNRFGWTKGEYRFAGAAGLLATLYGVATCLLAYGSFLNSSGAVTVLALGVTILMGYRFKTFKSI